mmetsp:Transcript_173/g.389  ORF Transcript_173/g.389 Transcript_173/m.389 type:complete len:280 (+) Transcript_173:911-1750(+)
MPLHGHSGPSRASSPSRVASKRPRSTRRSRSLCQGRRRRCGRPRTIPPFCVVFSCVALMRGASVALHLRRHQWIPGLSSYGAVCGVPSFALQRGSFSPPSWWDFYASSDACGQEQLILHHPRLLRFPRHSLLHRCLHRYPHRHCCQHPASPPCFRCRCHCSIRCHQCPPRCHCLGPHLLCCRWVPRHCLQRSPRSALPPADSHPYLFSWLLHRYLPQNLNQPLRCHHHLEPLARRPSASPRTGSSRRSETLDQAPARSLHEQPQPWPLVEEVDPLQSLE